LFVPAREENRMPQAILFDLDETLIDRTQSIARYAERFQRDFTGYLAPLSASTLAAAIVAADGRGYRPRADLCEALVRTLPWQTPQEAAVLQGHWATWFPSFAVARVGLTETLTALQAQGIRLGIVTNGRVQVRHTKIAQLGIRPYEGSGQFGEKIYAKPYVFIFQMD
jgi:putative hydrolase of the HAD superfamily